MYIYSYIRRAKKIVRKDRGRIGIGKRGRERESRKKRVGKPVRDVAYPIFR